MGRRYSFELFYPASRADAALGGLARVLPATRGRRHESAETAGRGAPAVDLSRLSPEAPVFTELSVLLPADEVVRRYADPLGELKSELTDDGLECLPVGVIDLAVRVGEQYALFSYTAPTSSISLIFQQSPAVWQQFSGLLERAGGVIGLFCGPVHRGRGPYPVLPDGREVIELDFFDFVLEERELYWHIDTDRYARAVLDAPRLPA